MKASGMYMETCSSLVKMFSDGEYNFISGLGIYRNILRNQNLG